MIDFLVNCTSVPYIIKIYTKQGNQKKTNKKTVGMETLNTHFFTNGIYFVQKINHLHKDRVANMWRNNVPSVCDRG
jgi:hypothetical protein